MNNRKTVIRFFTIADYEEEEKRKLYRITELGKEILNLEMKRIERLYKNSKGVEINE